MVKIRAMFGDMTNLALRLGLELDTIFDMINIKLYYSYEKLDGVEEGKVMTKHLNVHTDQKYNADATVKDDNHQDDTTATMITKNKEGEEEDR